MDELDNILNGESEAAPVEQQAPEPQQQEAEPAPTQPRGPDGKFAPKGKEEGAMPAPEDKQIPIQSYQAEKQKRKEWEERYRSDVEALRREIEALKQPKEPPAPPPSVWEDETAYGGHLVQQAVSQSAYQTRLATSEFYARKTIEGFSEQWDDLNKWLLDNPAIAKRAAEEADPWGFAFNQYRNFATVQELGATNIEELKAQLLEQLRAEQAQQPPAVSLPNSLADAQSSRGGNVPAPKPLTLEDILGN